MISLPRIVREAKQPGFQPGTCWLQIRCPNHYTQARSQGESFGGYTPRKICVKISWDIFWLTSSYNAPKCIISTPKPHKLQSVAKRLMILSLFFYLYKIQKVDSQETRQNCCQKTSDFTSKMHQIRCRLGFRPRPLWGSLQRSLRPLAGSKGPTSKGRRGEEGKGRKGQNPLRKTWLRA